MKPRSPRFDPFIAVPLAAIAVVVGVDLIIGPDMALISVLVVAPLAASLRLDPAKTAWVTVITVVVALAMGFPNEFFGKSTHMTRVLPVGLAGGLGVWMARLRVDRERAALMLAVQGSVSRILNESASLADATPAILGVIGGALDWQVGAMWEVDRDGDRLRCVERWSARGFEAAAFETVTGTSFEPGVGLPGRVWQSGLPASIPNLRRDQNFPRAAAAAETGLKAAFAFPIRSSEGVVGVMEFLGTRFRAIDRAQLEMLAGLGRQIGLFVDRQRAEGGRAELLEREHAARLAAERAEREAAETVALLDTLLARAPAGFGFVDPELRYVRANDALAATNGTTVEAMIGRRVADVIPELPEVVHTLRQVIRTGEPVTDVEVSGETRAEPGAEHHWIVSYYPVRAPRGKSLGVGIVVVEITERKRAESRAAFLSEATAALGSSLEYETSLRNLAALAVPSLADWCVVQLAEPDGTLTRVALAHTERAKEAFVADLTARYPPDPDTQVGAMAVIRTGRSQLIKEVDDSLLAQVAQDETHLELLRELGLRSGMTVPLVARGRPFGAITFASAESGRRFDEQDLALAEELGRRAGAAIDNARLYRERSNIARTLQASLLPPALPTIPGVELAARYRSAGEATDVGGDFYDVFPIGDRRWAAVLGDVLGKGPEAAALIGLARHTLRTAAMHDPNPASVLVTLNDALYAEGGEESVCTAVFMTIDVAEDDVTVELIAAGHPLPIRLGDDGTVERVGQPGTLLGAVHDLALNPTRVVLSPGDALVAFTDGVMEARSEEGLFGERRLESLVESLTGATARELAERVEQEAVDYQGGSPHDDLALLVARREPGAGGPAAAAQGAVPTDA